MASLRLRWADSPDGLKSICIFATLSLLMIFLIVSSTDMWSVPSDRGVDDWHYAQMSLDSDHEGIMAPFRQRILVPRLVALLPIPVPWGFAAVSSMTLGLAFAALWSFVLRLSTERMAWFCLGLLATTGLVNRVINSPFFVDSVILASAAVVFLFLQKRQWAALIIVMPIAVAGHELNLLLLIPIVLTAWREKRIPAASISVGFAIGTWLILHRSGWLVPPNDRPNLLDAGYRTEMIRWNLWQHGSLVGAIWFHIVGSFGVAWLIAPFGLRRATTLLRDGLWILPACVVLCLTASDWGRMFQVAAPVLFGLVSLAVEHQIQTPLDGNTARAD